MGRALRLIAVATMLLGVRARARADSTPADPEARRVEAIAARLRRDELGAATAKLLEKYPIETHFFIGLGGPDTIPGRIAALHPGAAVSLAGSAAALTDRDGRFGGTDEEASRLVAAALPDAARVNGRQIVLLDDIGGGHQMSSAYFLVKRALRQARLEEPLLVGLGRRVIGPFRRTGFSNPPPQPREETFGLGEFPLLDYEVAPTRARPGFGPKPLRLEVVVRNADATGTYAPLQHWRPIYTVDDFHAAGDGVAVTLKELRNHKPVVERVPRLEIALALLVDGGDRQSHVHLGSPVAVDPELRRVDLLPWLAEHGWTDLSPSLLERPASMHAERQREEALDAQQMTAFRRAMAYVPSDFILPTPLGHGVNFDRAFFGDILTDAFQELSLSRRQALLDRLRWATRSTPGAQVSLVLAELGPGYVKFGQLLANRPDLVGEAYRADLEGLSDDVPAMDPADVEYVLRGAYGADRPFASFAEETLGSGSIGQVHAATLRDGRRVVVKVVKRLARRDLARNLAALQRAIESRTEGESPLTQILSELRRVTLRETDMGYEAGALGRAARNLEKWGITDESVPEVIPELSTRDVLVITEARGARLDQATFTGPEQQRAAARRIFASVARQIWLDGFFHADPHKGNVFLDGSPFHLAYLDWGLSESIARPERTLLGLLAAAVLRGNARLTVVALRRLDAGTVKEVDLDRIVREELADDKPPFRRLQGIVTRAQTAGFKLPPASVMAVKALLLAEGVALRLDPSFRPHTALAPALRSLRGSPRAFGSRMRPAQPRRRAAKARRAQGR